MPHRRAHDDSVIAKIHQKLSAQMQNIVLIGMPGCGKSTVAQALAKKLGRKAVDADEEIVRCAGKTVPEIFAEDGEEAFREWETKVLNELGKQSSLIIATGGGCVTRERNYPLLHQNATIFWLERDITLLPTEGRPLSQSTTLTEMYRKRRPLYEQFADCRIDNNGSPEETIAAICGYLEDVK